MITIFTLLKKRINKRIKKNLFGLIKNSKNNETKTDLKRVSNYDNHKINNK